MASTPPPPPPPVTGLAIPPAAQTVAGIPAASRFGTAAEFYDGFGVNVHFAVGGTPYQNHTATIAELAELGVRHVRDTIHHSKYSGVANWHRRWCVALNNRNKQVLAGTASGQPIFVLAQTSGHTGRYPYTQIPFTMTEFLASMDGGVQHFFPGSPPRTPIPNGTTSDQNAEVPNPWAWADPEVPWSVMGMVSGPNEPDLTSPQTLKAWNQEMLAKMRVRTQQAFGGHRVVLTGGLSSNVKVNQIPVTGPSIIGAGVAISAGDMSKGTNSADLGDVHCYHVGHEPSTEWITKEISGAGQPSAWANGRLKAGTYDPANSLPFVATEFGQQSRGGAWGYPSGHSGYWPTPEDLQGEIAIRTRVILWRNGVRRGYAYEFADPRDNPGQDAHNNFGYIDSFRRKKAMFYAERNFYRLIGFTAPEAADKAPLAFSWTVSPAVTGNNDHIGKFTGAGDFGQTGNGQVYHQNAKVVTVDQLQCSSPSATVKEYRMVVCHHTMLWDREPGNWDTVNNVPKTFGDEAAGRKTPTAHTVTITFTGGIDQAWIATPTAGGAQAPGAGETWAPLTVTPAGANDTVQVPIAGYTKVLKVTKGVSQPAGTVFAKHGFETSPPPYMSAGEGDVTDVGPQTVGSEVITPRHGTRMRRFFLSQSDVNNGLYHCKSYWAFYEGAGEDAPAGNRATSPPADVSGTYRAWIYFPAAWSIPSGGITNVMQFKTRIKRDTPTSGYESWNGHYLIVDSNMNASVHWWTWPSVAAMKANTANPSPASSAGSVPFPKSQWVEVRCDIDQNVSAVWRVNGTVVYTLPETSSVPIDANYMGSYSLAWAFGFGRYALGGQANRYSPSPLYVDDVSWVGLGNADPF